MKFELFGRAFYFLAQEGQLKKALDMLERYLFKPELLVLMLVFAVYLFIRLLAKIRKKDNLLNNLKKISPWVYLLMILGITLFNRASGSREIRFVFDNWFTQTGFHETTVLGFVFNTCIYIPFGYLLYKYLNFPRKWILTAGFVFSSSLLIEILQFILARGVTAIDDLIANTIGGLIGLCIAFLFENLRREKSDE